MESMIRNKMPSPLICDPPLQKALATTVCAGRGKPTPCSMSHVFHIGPPHISGGSRQSKHNFHMLVSGCHGRRLAPLGTFLHTSVSLLRSCPRHRGTEPSPPLCSGGIKCHEAQHGFLVPVVGGTTMFAR